jgi:hypothetical protein
MDEARENQREQGKARRYDDEDGDGNVSRNHLYKRGNGRRAPCESGWFIARDLKGGQESGSRRFLCRKLKILNHFYHFIA